MNTLYEFMVLVNTSVDLDTDKKQTDFVKKLIGDAAEITSIVSLGKKRLAYDIKKQKEATYLVAQLSGHIVVTDIDKRSKLQDAVLRFLLTVKE
ncbi:MAG: 30S ribosomal protein S6 [Patescibacteria group bacterium]